MKKRVNSIISILLAFVMLIGFTVTAFAAETAPTLVVDSMQAVKGQTATVKLSVENNPGMAAATFRIVYDSSILKLNSVDFNTEFGGDFDELGSLALPVAGSDDLKAIQISWSSLSNISSNGTFLSMNFTVNENAEKGSIADVFTSFNTGDFCNIDEEDVNFISKDGQITIIEGVPGDINADKTVNSKDLIRLRKYFGGFDVEVDIIACDCNGDGNVNSKDLMRLRKYFSGWNVELFYGPSIPVCRHSLTKTEATPATCIKNGNFAYWYCSNCNKYFADENATTEIALEDTVIEKTGHTVVIVPEVPATPGHPGSTEGSKCSVCGEWIKVPEPIDPPEEHEYTITYHLSNGDEYLAQQMIDNSNPVVYTSENGVTRFNNPSVPGYQFLGWYDLPSGDAAENVKSIPVGTTGNIDLYARWEKISYKVNFSSDLIPVASETYTVDEEHVLPSPKLDGYIFAGWSDDEGTVIKNIPSGTVGVKTYTANWLSERNQAWTYKNVSAPLMYEDNESNTILFVYNIGEIRNVPLSVIHDFGKINGSGVAKTERATYSTTIDEECMNKYTNTVQHATTDSYSWTLAKEWSNSTTVNETWAKENSVSEEQINSYYKDQSSNWYVSSGSSGSDSITSTDTSSDSLMLSSVRNKKTDDKHSSSVETNISANLDVKNTTTIGAKIPVKFVDISAENKTEIGAGVSGSINTKESNSNRVQTDNTNSAQYNKQNYASTTANSTSSWNNESGYGGSSTVGQSQSVSKAISEKISEEYNIGKSYINTDSESSTQGTQTSQSKADEYSSAVTYSTIKGEEITTEVTTENTTSGYHRWIKAGTAHVFAVVGYDIATKSYFTTTYSVMDDKTYDYEDYSYQTASYDDNESSLLQFEVPMDITEYVANRVCESDGLEISKSGIITNYTGTDKYVVIPEYKVIDNQDGTSSVIKVTGISSTAFAGKDITGIELSDFITEVPANAFENCSLLESINAAGIKKIGNNAFAGCTNLEELVIGNNITEIGTNIVSNNTILIVSAANKSIIENAAQSGAKEIYIRITDKCQDFNDAVLTVPNSTDTFILNGFGETYNNIRIVSDAKKTIINRANFVCNGQTPLVISSPNVELHEVNVTSPGICLALTADSTNLALRGESTLKAASGNSMLCKEISISQIDASLATSLTVDGNLLICTSKDSILAGEKFLIVTGQTIGITLQEFNNYLKGVFTANFNANGGTVSETNRTVVYGSTLGTLPTPTRDYYTFDGWYTAADGGEEVTADTVFNSTEDVTYYAHWTINSLSDWVLVDSVPSEAKIVNNKWTYDLTTKTTSNNSTLDGYTLENTTYTYKTQYRSRTRSKTKVYNYWRYAAQQYGGMTYNYQESGTQRYTYTSTSELAYYNDYGGGTYKYWYNNGANFFPVLKASTFITYNYGSWSGWSAWQDSPISKSDTKDVGTQQAIATTTYHFTKTEQKESDTIPSGDNISNVQEWVQYRVK